MTNEQFKKAVPLFSEREKWFQEFKKASDCINKYTDHTVVSVGIEDSSIFINKSRMDSNFLIKAEYVVVALQSHLQFCQSKIDEINLKISEI